MDSFTRRIHIENRETFQGDCGGREEEALHREGASVRLWVRARRIVRGNGMQLKETVHHLTDMIWELEQRSKHPMEDAILTYVRDAVAAEIEYRRRLHELDRRLAELKNVQEIPASA